MREVDADVLVIRRALNEYRDSAGEHELDRRAFRAIGRALGKLSALSGKLRGRALRAELQCGIAEGATSRALELDLGYDGEREAITKPEPAIDTFEQ